MKAELPGVKREDADAANVRAESMDGVLNVHIPKTKVEKSKAVEIKVQ